MKQSQIKAMKRAIGAYTKKAVKTPDAARAALVKEGIYRQDGSLSPNYRVSSKTAA